MSFTPFTTESSVAHNVSVFPSKYKRYGVDTPTADRVYALDCEMVDTEQKKSAAGRVALVDYSGKLVVDCYVDYGSSITDYKTKYSGLNANSFAAARNAGKLVSLVKAQDQVLEYIRGALVVGHGISNDLAALSITGATTFDTLKVDNQNLDASMSSVGIPFRQNGHNPVEDARASMFLYRVA